MLHATTMRHTSACLPVTGCSDVNMFRLARQEGKRSMADEPERPALSEVHLQAVASTSARDGADADGVRHGGGGGHRVAFAGDTVLHVRAPRGHVTGMAALGLTRSALWSKISCLPVARHWCRMLTSGRGGSGPRPAFLQSGRSGVRAGGLDAVEPVTGRKGSFAAAAAFVLPPPEDELAEVATSHTYQVGAVHRP